MTTSKNHRRARTTIGTKAALSLAALAAGPVLASAAQGKPNVVIVVTHDAGGAAAPTASPNRDAWAARGATFANAYSAAPQPGPDDVALLTGRSPQRVGFELDPDPAAEGPAKFDVPQPTFAQTFKAAGYATGAFGNEPDDAAVVGRPGQRGFDEVRLVSDPTADDAAAFIQAHAAQPFFTYLSLDGAGPDLDGRLGQIASALHDRGLEANTVLVLVQAQTGSPWSLRAQGLRAQWTLIRPDAVPGGRVIPQSVAATDLAATVLAAADLQPAADPRFEGTNLYPLAQNPGGQPPDRPIFWRLGPQYAAQLGSWRLLKSGSHEPHPKLYDIGHDSAERVDLFEQHRKEAADLQERWDAWNAGNQPSHWTDFRADGPPADVADAEASAARQFGPLKSDDSLVGRSAPGVANKALEVTAQVDFDGSDGVIVSQGATAQGYALYVLNGKLEFAVREDGEITSIAAAEPLKKGTFTVRATLTGKGALALLVDGTQVATGAAPGLIPRQPKNGLSVGRAGNTAVGNNATPGTFHGRVREVTIKVG